MPHSQDNEELARLKARMAELLAQSEEIEQRMVQVKSEGSGVIDTTTILSGADVVPGSEQRSAP
jgi:hypothetical protein